MKTQLLNMKRILTMDYITSFFIIDTHLIRHIIFLIYFFNYGDFVSRLQNRY